MIIKQNNYFIMSYDNLCHVYHIINCSRPSWKPALRWTALACLILNTLTSVWTFSILFSIHFLRCWQGEFVHQSRASLVCDYMSFIFVHELNVWFRGDIVRRSQMLVTLTFTMTCMFLLLDCYKNSYDYYTVNFLSLFWFNQSINQLFIYPHSV